MSIGLNIIVEKEKKFTTIRIDGRLDAVSSPILEKKILEIINGDTFNIVLDFSRLNYLSSAGMRLILSITKKLNLSGGALNCCSIGEDAMEIIKMAGFERIINIFPTEQEALQNFN